MILKFIYLKGSPTTNEGNVSELLAYIFHSNNLLDSTFPIDTILVVAKIFLSVTKKG